jgi:hypothetical protein
MRSDGGLVNRARWLRASLWLALAIAGVAGCATTTWSRIHPHDAPGGALVLAQVAVRFTRDTIINDEQTYRILLASGIDKPEIRDGSVALARVNCCGGSVESTTAIGFYISETVPAEVGDIVEVKLGRAPEKEGDLGQANRATRVIQKGTELNGSCRWEPANPRLWGRVLYCDWMRNEGWVQEGPKATLDKAWIKRP